MPESNKSEDKKDNENPSHRSIDNILRNHLANPDRSIEYVKSEIIRAIREQDSYEYSIHGYTITYEGLCRLLPELTREEIVLAIVDMQQVETLSSEMGTINFPAICFWVS
jgi:hypothetical protein